MVRPLASSYLLVDLVRPLHDGDDDGLRRPLSATLSKILGVAQIYASSSLLLLHFSHEKDFDSTQIFQYVSLCENGKCWSCLSLPLSASLCWLRGHRVTQ